MIKQTEPTPITDDNLFSDDIFFVRCGVQSTDRKAHTVIEFQ